MRIVYIPYTLALARGAAYLAMHLKLHSVAYVIHWTICSDGRYSLQLVCAAITAMDCSMCCGCA